MAHANTTTPAANPLVVIKRQTRVYRNGRTNICMIIPKDVAELTKLAAGDVLQVTASEDGKFHTERADQIGTGGGAGK